MIKLDIINEVVNRTGITKTKAEMAVETVFESMKRAHSAAANALSFAVDGSLVSSTNPAKTGEEIVAYAVGLDGTQPSFDGRAPTSACKHRLVCSICN